MNKKLRFAAPVAAFALGIATVFSSCKEKSSIDLGLGPAASDTTFTASVESPQQRNVLIEEFTGVTCPNCPQAHVILASLKAQYGSRVPVIGFQVFGFGQANPVIENGDTITRHDNRTLAGTDLTTGIFGALGAAPMAGIDRTLKNGSLYIGREFWNTEVSSRLTLPTNANVTITSDYNTAANTVAIKVHVAYTAAVAKRQKLTVAIIEDKVIDAQEDGSIQPPKSKVIDEYEHEHVLRDILTTATGSTMMNDDISITAGRVYERTFVYDMSQHPLWVPENCKVVAYVCDADAGDKEVQQAAEVKLK